jgi:hypothetical protein
MDPLLQSHTSTNTKLGTRNQDEVYKISITRHIKPCKKTTQPYTESSENAEKKCSRPEALLLIYFIIESIVHKTT